MKNLKISIAFFCAMIFFAGNSFSQLVSFPGAEGAGSLTTGGRGTPSLATTVFEVTRLDDPSPTVVGTFRYACTNNSPVATHRTVVFRVSGTINLTSSLSLNRANTTIAGQTAPGDGICIADYPVSISANNIIVRFMRFRLGDKNQLKTTPANCGVPVAPFNASCMPLNGSGGDDAFGGTGRKNIMIDHCSMSWSNDEVCTIYSGDSTTLQWNIFSEPLNYSYHFETGDTDFEQHGYGGIWGGRSASFHHNLLAHMVGRMPRFDGVRNLGDVIGAENVDFRNNVLYNWSSYNVNGGEGGNYNIVNNYYKWGPNTPSSTTSGVNRRNMVINPYKQSSPALPFGKYYLSGNHVDNSATVTANNWLGAAMNSGSFADTSGSKVTTPFPILPINTQSALDAYNSVLDYAGCILPNRDTLDVRILNDVRNRTGRIIDVQGGYPHGTPYAQTVNAWPTLHSTTAPDDTDKDGMPDAWELSMSLNPNNATDRNTYHANGYTMLENYLNGLVAVLPLKLLTFSAQLLGNEVKTTWTTSNEVNTKSFIIERSVDGRKFSAIGIVEAKNTIRTNEYFFTDSKSLDGISYYRLQMLDIDGNFTYSVIIKVSKTKLSILSVVPNPVADRLVLSHPVVTGNADIAIVDASGRQVLQQKAGQGTAQSFLQVANLSTGVYQIIFRNNDGKLNIQFVKN